MSSAAPHRSTRLRKLLAGFALTAALLSGAHQLATAQAHGQVLAQVQGQAGLITDDKFDWNNVTTGYIPDPDHKLQA